MNPKLLIAAPLFLIILYCQCGKSGSAGNNTNNTGGNSLPSISDITLWLTTPDKGSLLKQATGSPTFNKTTDTTSPAITVDSTKSYQTIDGFGFTLTGGSAYVIYNMGPSARAPLLRELFSNDDNAVSISYLRLSMGASDLSSTVFSYDDLPSGQTDTPLAHFSLAADTSYLIPLLKEIVAINPSIKIIATPWSPPTWMKDNNSSIAGSLKPEYYAAYARYFIQYIRSMKARGITIDAITPQNEPLNPNNNPSMYMTAREEASFIKNYLGPAFDTAGITTKIIAYDHNCDHPEYATTILGDAAASSYVNGSAFHLYAGDIDALSTVHAAYPARSLYFTEQYTASTGSFGPDLQWHIKNVVIGAMNNWSRNALEWNLATDISYGPHTSGGCTTCQGALTISGSTVTRNVSYYIIAHAARFVPPGSIRIASTVAPAGLINTAFLTPAGKKVLIVENTGSYSFSFSIRFNGKWVTTSLAAGAVGTYVW
jgi:glucosylceramidase